MDFLRGVSQAIKDAASSNNSETFSRVATELVKSKDRAREEFQALTADKIRAITQALENNRSLNEEEKDLVKLWVVGDAQGYIKMEDSLRGWMEELRRLSEVIKDYEQKVLSPQDFVNLHGVLEDAVKIAGAIAHYLDDKERIARFEKAINNLDAAGSKLIADILKGSLTATDM